MTRGAVTVTAVLTFAIPLAAALAAYYANIIKINQDISVVEASINKEIGLDRQRITALETNVNINIPEIKKAVDDLNRKIDILIQNRYGK